MTQCNAKCKSGQRCKNNAVQSQKCGLHQHNKNQTGGDPRVTEILNDLTKYYNTALSDPKYLDVKLLIKDIKPIIIKYLTYGNYNDENYDERNDMLVKLITPIYPRALSHSDNKLCHLWEYLMNDIENIIEDRISESESRSRY